MAKNIAFGIHRLPKAEQKSRVQAMLALVGLTEHANKRPAQLSGGQQQRVALARALAPKPNLLLLDEPFSNLDVVLRESLAMSVRDILKRTQTTAILVTHDQHEAFALADKIGVMQAGKLVQWATPSQLYHEPATPFVADFIGEGALIDGVIKQHCIECALGVIPLVEGNSSSAHAKHELKGIELQKINDFDEHHHTHLDSQQANPSGNSLDAIKQLPEGAVVKVLIRPDDVIHDDKSQMQAHVVSRVFRGAYYFYHLRLHSGEQIVSLIPSHHDHQVGSNIGITPRLKHVVVFTA